MALSTDKILGAVLAKIEEMSPRVCGNYLDIGATRGHLIRLVSHKFGVTATACDYTRELIRIPGLKIDLVDLNHDLLPYPEAHFDLVKCTEVTELIEHIEHYRHTIREIFRVLKPGLFVVTTPNILNLRSRVRYLLLVSSAFLAPCMFAKVIAT